MRIAHLSYCDQRGGAAKAAYRIHRGVRERGLDSRMFVIKKDTDDDSVYSPTRRSEILRNELGVKLDTIPVRLRLDQCGLRSSGWLSSSLVRRVREFAPSVVQLNWVASGVVSIRDMPRFDVPVIWRFCDMWPMGGGEHYLGVSQRFIEGYSRANRPESLRGFDVDRWIWKRKVKYWENWNHLHVVAPSNWMAGEARKSRLFQERDITVIPTGVDTDIFRKRERGLARAELGLPQDASIILFVAQSASEDRRKGFDYLVQAVRRLVAKGGEFQIAIAGVTNAKEEFDLGVPTHVFQRTEDLDFLSRLYSAADVFTAPSIEENLANTVLEAMACRVPCVAFDVGGMPDAIDHKENGWLAEPESPEDLAEGLEWIISDKELGRALGEKAHEKINNGFTLENQACAFEGLYRRVTAA